MDGDKGKTIQLSIDDLEDKKSFNKLNGKEKEKLLMLAKKYQHSNNDNFIISRETRKTIKYIEDNIENFPNEYKVLKERIINGLYNILYYVYKSNIFNDKEDKKEIILNIMMVDFLIERAFDKKLISYKKYERYGNHLMSINLMVRKWITNEKIQ